jgi:NADPH:quinone reductase-like Zn-dependent oxidoreductase
MSHELDIRGGTGDADALFISSEIEKPKPTQGQALVKIKAFGLNRMDLLQRAGLFCFDTSSRRQDLRS